MTNCRDILLVEDNPDDATLTLRAFRKKNILNPIVVVKDGEEALDYLHGTGPYAGCAGRDLPALVLLDLKLPKIDGLEVLRQIRADERTRLVRVVILTSSNEEMDIVRGYSLCASSYIRKPVDLDRFVEVAGQLGLYWLLLNEPPPQTATNPA